MTISPTTSTALLNVPYRNRDPHTPFQEFAVLKCLQNADLLGLKNFLVSGLRPDSVFTHPVYKESSLLGVVVFLRCLSWEQKYSLAEMILKEGGSASSLVAGMTVAKYVSVLAGPQNFRLVFFLLFSLSGSQARLEAAMSCENIQIRRTLLSAVTAANAFALLKTKQYTACQESIKISCIKGEDLYSSEESKSRVICDIDKLVPNRSYNLLQFTVYHLTKLYSFWKPENHEDRQGLESVMKSLLKLGANPVERKRNEYSCRNTGIFRRIDNKNVFGFSPIYI